MTFSQRQLRAQPPLDIGEVLRDMHTLLLRVAGEHIHVVVRAARPVGVSIIDRENVERVIMNLVVNARDAMPTGGTVTLETSLVELDASAAQAHGCPRPGPYAVLSVADTGTGMDEAVRARMFEAYFTTKPEGQGTGLGLATVLAIIDQAGGHVHVDSAPDRGTRFDIYLPVHVPDADASL